MVSKSLKFGPKWQFLCFKPVLSAIFVNIATVKFKPMPKFYLSAILQKYQSKEISEKQFSLLGSRRGQNSPLMHVPTYYFVKIRSDERFVKFKITQCFKEMLVSIFFTTKEA